MNSILAVGCGGFLGCIFRYLITTGSMKLKYFSHLPIGTLIANLLGCLLMGMLGAYIESKHNISTVTTGFLMTGFLGGLTTFSSFEYDIFTILREGQYGYALGYLSTQVLFGYALLIVGFKLFAKG